MVSRIAITLILTCLSIQTVDASSFGRTAGNFGVSQFGSAQYSIPIWAPPGPRGVQPNIALTYDSGAGVGPLGIGWSIGGLSSITRCNRTYAQDGVPAPVALTTADGFCLNGKRLRLTSGTYGTDGSTYQTEVADFSNVTAHSSVGNGPAYFTVQGKDGLTYQYGFTDSNGNGANSQVVLSGTAATWLLSKVIDRAGNNLVINYVVQNGTTLAGTTVPNTILWTPTSAGASTYSYQMQFNYTANNVPQSSPAKYIAGSPIANTQLLGSIAISYQGTIIKDYFLGYQSSPTTGRYELNSVKDCADTAQSNCLLPTSVGYQSGTSGVSSTATTITSNGSPLAPARYDLNGDGIPDLIYVNGTTTYVAFGSPTGFQAPISTSIPGYVLIGKVDGGSEDGVLTVVSGTWWYYKWNGSSFTGTSTGLAYDSTQLKYQLADINGDGLPDLISWSEVKESGFPKYDITVYSRLNTSSGGAVHFSTTLNTAFAYDFTDGAELQTPDMQFGKIREFDFNGDGMDDLVLMVITGNSPNYTMSTYALLSTGTGTFTASLVNSISGASYQPLQFINLNDDGCTDFLIGGTLIQAACNGMPAASPQFLGTILAQMDWDGDGRTDILVANGSTIGVYLSTGSGVSSLVSTSIPYSSSCQYVTADANGDGLDDLICLSQTGTNPITYYLHNGSGQPPDLLSSIADGYGVTYSPTYVPLSASSGAYAKGSSAAFPNQDYAGPMYVVSSYASSDGIGGTFSSTYSYAGAVLNLQGRGLQGFTTVSSTDSRTGLKDTRTYSTGTLSAGIEIPTAGMLTAESVTQSAGTNVSVGTYALTWLTLDSTTNNQRYFPYTSSSSVNTYEVQAGGSYNGLLITTTAMNYGTPDIYGNFPSVEKTLTDEDSGSPFFGQQWTTTTATTVSASPSTWCNSLPTERDVTNTAPGVPTIIRHVTYLSPDYTNCRQTEQVIESGNPTYQVDTKYAYNPADLGNLTGVTVTGIGMSARTTTTAWGVTGQFPTTVSNALTQTSHTNFDPITGNLLSIQDPNGITASWQYDPFGRKIKETKSDNTSTSWAYNSCATAGCVNSNNVMTVVASGDTLSNTYLDRFDRVLITSKPLFFGNYNRVETQYDNLGRPHLEGMPCSFASCVQYWTTNTYDILNRLTESQRPISASNPTLQSTNITYQGRTTTTTDPQGKTVTAINLVTGAPYRTKDNNNYYVNFNRDAFGSVLSVTDSLTNTLRTMTYAYGIKPFRKTLNDMDLGSRSFTVDALGEITAYSDGKGNDFSAIFDALSRLTSRTEPDLTTSWTWGTTAASDNIGQLASVSSSSSSGTYSEAFTYDSASRVSDHQFTIPNLGTLAFDYTYDASDGLLASITFPASYPSTFRLRANFAYQWGIPYFVRDGANTSNIWWQLRGTSWRGQVSGETTTDSSTDPTIDVTHNYDAVTGWLTSVSGGLSFGSSALQNESYLYDEVGNVTQRQNNNLGLTESFYYDNLYRLDHSMLGSGVNLQMAYDAMGDITSRSDVAGGAAWTYDPVRKHAVTQAGSSAFTYAYDGNGNVTSRNGSIIGWTSYNYPAGVSTSTESATFDYGPNRQRWRMVYSGPSGVETTYYATPAFEAVATAGGMDYRHYIYFAGKPIMVISRTTAGAVNVRSLLANHQGSISSIVTDSTGASLVSESFTAYGNRREASTWTGAPTSGELTTMNGVTREGYTFQTVLGSMGLNHMNGRIEDSVTGRFLSPDPRGTIAGNTQSWNRYSYVNNNPVSFTDPTGFRVVPYCQDWCPGKNWHPGPWAYSSFSNWGDGGLAGFEGSVMSDSLASANAYTGFMGATAMGDQTGFPDEDDDPELSPVVLGQQAQRWVDLGALKPAFAIMIGMFTSIDSMGEQPESTNTQLATTEAVAETAGAAAPVTTNEAALAEALIEGRAVTTLTNKSTVGAAEPNIAINVTASDAVSNLMSNGYTVLSPAASSELILGNAGNFYTIYPRVSGGTGMFSNSGGTFTKYTLSGN